MASYAYTNGQGISALDATTPLGTEPVSAGDDAIRQIKAYLKDPTKGPEARLTAFETLLTALETTVNTAPVPPVGSITAYCVNTIPSGWLLCDGSAVSRTTYQNLFNLIGVLYGVGNGTTTFNLPDLRGRVIASVDNGASRIPGATLASSGGAHEVALTEANNGPHKHFAIANVVASDSNAVAPSATNSLAKTKISGSDYNLFSDNASTVPSLGLTSSSGLGTPHANLQPYLTLNYIIKT